MDHKKGIKDGGSKMGGDWSFGDDKDKKTGSSLDMDRKKGICKDGGSKMGGDWSFRGDKDKKTLPNQPKLDSFKFINIVIYQKVITMVTIKTGCRYLLE